MRLHSFARIFLLGVLGFLVSCHHAVVPPEPILGKVTLILEEVLTESGPKSLRSQLEELEARHRPSVVLLRMPASPQHHGTSKVRVYGLSGRLMFTGMGDADEVIWAIEEALQGRDPF